MGAPACIQDEPIPTPKDYAGWDRSGHVVWRAIEELGGILPDIEEDRTQAPPAWWRYPSPLRSAFLLSHEAERPDGLYSGVAPDDLRRGDLLVRPTGAGPCGKMAVVVDRVGDNWLTQEAEGEGLGTVSNSPTFFAEDDLRPEVRAYRIRVRKNETMGHVREIRRDLAHLERTVAERPPLIARKGRIVVDEKVHELVDEAWSLVADAKFDLERRELTGRALALGAALDWPGALEAAAGVLDDVLRRDQGRVAALASRARLLLLAGEAQKAVLLAEAAAGLQGQTTPARYVLGRSLIAAGREADGLAQLRRYVDAEPGDARARRLLATNGREPALVPAPRMDPAIKFVGGADQVGAVSGSYGFRVQWPITWRVVGLSATGEAGLVVSLTTGRVVLDNGETERGSADVFAQRPEPAEVAATVKRAARNIYPQAKTRTLKPLIPGSRREHFKEKQDGVSYEGEVTTLQKNGVVYFLVLRAPSTAYPKLREDYAALARGAVFTDPPAPQVPTPGNDAAKP